MSSQLQSSPRFLVANLTSSEQEQLRLVADEEQRSILYREMRRGHAIGREDDYTDLSIAENVLTFPSLRTKVFEILKKEPELIRERDMLYFTSYGTPDLRASVAARLTESFQANPKIDAKNLFGIAGVSPALRAIAMGLQLPMGNDPGVPVPRGSSVLVPAPFWQGFHWSFKQGPDLTVVPVNLGEKFELTLEALQYSYDLTEPKPKLLTLTNPHNPLGVNYDRELLESIYRWALQDTDMHIISDEMYCHSQLHPAAPGGGFVSALALTATQFAPERVHVVWGFAKDFGLSGFRAGFVISSSPYVRNAMLGANDWLERRAGLSWFSSFDSLKHRFILPLAADPGSVWNDVMTDYQTQLPKAHDVVAKVLDDANIGYQHADAAQFFWLDLRPFLPRSNGEVNEYPLFASPLHYGSEQALAQDILDNAGVKLLTGGAMYCPIEGYFRLCYTGHHLDETQKAVQRMVDYLARRR